MYFDYDSDNNIQMQYMIDSTQRSVFFNSSILRDCSSLRTSWEVAGRAEEEDEVEEEESVAQLPDIALR